MDTGCCLYSVSELRGPWSDADVSREGENPLSFYVSYLWLSTISGKWGTVALSRCFRLPAIFSGPWFLCNLCSLWALSIDGIPGTANWLIALVNAITWRDPEQSEAETLAKTHKNPSFPLPFACNVNTVRALRIYFATEKLHRFRVLPT